MWRRREATCPRRLDIQDDSCCLDAAQKKKISKCTKKQEYSWAWSLVLTSIQHLLQHMNSICVRSQAKKMRMKLFENNFLLILRAILQTSLEATKENKKKTQLVRDSDSTAISFKPKIEKKKKTQTWRTREETWEPAISCIFPFIFCKASDISLIRANTSIG